MLYLFLSFLLILIFSRILLSFSVKMGYTIFNNSRRMAGQGDAFRRAKCCKGDGVHAFTIQYPILQSIEREQKERHFNFEQMKLLRLQELLVLIRRIQLSQFQLISREASWKEDMISAVLTQIDQDLSQNIDFEGIARGQGITLSYFRMIFKEITGMPPTDYLNRVRILHALELLQTSDAPVAEIGRKVGIYDANYFSRLFKKITGYPPRYFKSIPHKDEKKP